MRALIIGEGDRAVVLDEYEVGRLLELLDLASDTLDEWALTADREGEGDEADELRGQAHEADALADRLRADLR